MDIGDRRLILWLMVFWVGLFILAHWVGGMTSSLRPDTDREHRIAVWPPSRPLWKWFERVWFAPFERWDAFYFIRVARQGYSVNDGTAQFHPLFPAMARPLTILGIPALVSLSWVNFISATALLCVLFVWARLDAGSELALSTTLLFLASPFAFVLHLPYSEPLFLLLTSLCFVFVRRRQWGWAGLAGALATLTRQQGLLLVVPMAIGLGESCNWKPCAVIKRWRPWAAIALVPLAYAGWIGYRALALSDLSPNFANLTDFIYSVLISPSAFKVVSEQTFMWPWKAFAYAMGRTMQAPDIDMVINLGLSALFLLYTILAWRDMKLGSKLFTVMIVFLSFSYSTGPVHPYKGLPRHLLLAVPVFVGLGKRVTAAWARMTLMVGGILGQMVLVIAFVLHAWVP